MQAGETINFSTINSAFALVDAAVELSIRHIEQGLGTGAFFGHVAVYAANSFSAARIGQMIAGALSGSHSHARPFQVIPCSGIRPLNAESGPFGTGTQRPSGFNSAAPQTGQASSGGGSEGSGAKAVKVCLDFA